MPRVARFKIAALGELFRQLMYAPLVARRRQMEAAEQLVAQIDPQQVYPEEFIIFRITGYRPDLPDEPVGLVGEALVADLVTLIQRLSQGLDLSSLNDDRTPVMLDDLARRLNISAKTLQRYRKQGLVCHYVVFGDGTQRLACFEDSLQRFARRHRGKIAHASEFSRVGETVVRSIIHDARDLRRTPGMSLNAVAKQLARKYGRAHETLRSILHRHDRRGDEPIFTEMGPLTDRDIRLIHRAAERGVSWGVLCRRFFKTRPTIDRAVNRRRRELLGALDLKYILPTSMPSADGDDAESVILSSPAVTSGLADLPPHHDALAFIEAIHQADTPPKNIEQALVGGYNLLKRRARVAIEALSEYPASNVLDQIETDLRWATLLKRRLVVIGLPAAVGCIEQALHRSLEHQPSEEILTLFRLAFAVIGGAVETIDPSRGRRLGRRCGYAMNRALAARQHRPAVGRAATRHQPGSVILADPFGSLNPWQRWLALRSDLQPLVVRLDAPLQRMITLRYGLSGFQPRTLAELAGQLRLNRNALARTMRSAHRQLRSLAANIPDR